MSLYDLSDDQINFFCESKMVGQSLKRDWHENEYEEKDEAVKSGELEELNEMMQWKGKETVCVDPH